MKELRTKSISKFCLPKWKGGVSSVTLHRPADSTLTSDIAQAKIMNLTRVGPLNIE
ncbi:protein of unknown function [Nitrospira japonica]|uniref:Uncharacterized protein n=1 Tax=Nitrospira japonica TaxID=1325564 RepID=A0A1W1I1D0_9BACT|nr:protein of unknown function [Nitrospira japonica]